MVNKVEYTIISVTVICAWNHTSVENNSLKTKNVLICSYGTGDTV